MYVTDRHRIIFLNGPPHCGKDTAKHFIRKEIKNIRTYDMLRPIADAFRGLFDIPVDQWYRNYEKWKSEGEGEFLGYNLRPLMISFSEDWVKDMFGKDAFGKLAVRRLAVPTSTCLTVVSSVGFREEVEPIVERFNKQYCLLIRISRPNCTYDGDSRGHIELPDVTTIEIDNCYDLPMFEIQILRAVKQWAFPHVAD